MEKFITFLWVFMQGEHYIRLDAPKPTILEVIAVGFLSLFWMLTIYFLIGVLAYIGYNEMSRNKSNNK